MANQTMMMIVTSNKDLIRQVSLSNASDTHIVNLNVFANNYTQSKSTQVSKKPTDCRCTICGDRASGFNYHALSCASCERQCLVSYGIRRRCPQCRLERCVKMGMRKDFLLSEERKQQRRKYFQETRKDDSVYLNQRNSTTIAILPDDDLVLTENLRSLFLLIFEKYDVQCACVDVSDQKALEPIQSQIVGSNRFIKVVNKRCHCPSEHGLTRDESTLDKLPTVRGNDWRGASNDVGNNFPKNQTKTWWNVNSCSSSINVIEDFLLARKQIQQYF
ncbi:unnamed protein product [Adineta ricciae]|uniref:Nuclear receptor domain-containing protein n=1 Tax=Adineta ricciae TaxID=249248 RepID=A0A814V6A8_ADIRI|nr:unnamed protein product [Adineta ricciae]